MKTRKNRFYTAFRRISPLSASAFAAFLLLSLLLSAAFRPMAGEETLYANTIRFHILANSDSDEDQALKLRVRDRVTAYTARLLADCTSKDEAAALLEAHKEDVLALARREIEQSGYSYPVAWKSGKEVYPRRVYGGCTFPAGVYDSVQLRIGSAEGHNWWCVLFPPLCTSAATLEKIDGDTLSRVGFSDSEVRLLTDGEPIKREIRFFVLDLLAGQT